MSFIMAFALHMCSPNRTSEVSLRPLAHKLFFSSRALPTGGFR
jgi:hypothetical protein